MISVKYLLFYIFSIEKFLKKENPTVFSLIGSTTVKCTNTLNNCFKCGNNKINLGQKIAKNIRTKQKQFQVQIFRENKFVLVLSA